MIKPISAQQTETILQGSVGLEVQEEIVVEWIFEWDKGTPVHRRVQMRLNESRKGNLYFELGEDPYVVTDLRNGAPVLGRKNGRWSPAGRVLRGGQKVFLGKWNEPSFDELLDMGRTPPSYPLEPLSVYPG